VADLTQSTEDRFWYWIAERHAIYLRRQAGQPKPWTTDPILLDYKFTNPFRENDRGTVWLRENFLEPHKDAATHTDSCASQGAIGGQGLEFIPCDCPYGKRNLELLAFNIGWYRMFNWCGTGAFLEWQIDWTPLVIQRILEQRLYEKKQVFTGAHIVYSPPGISKIEAIVQVCTDLWGLRDKIAHTARVHRSLAATFNVLTTVHCVGGFMAYEMVTDMRHTQLLEDATDIYTWANPGPGALRGLQRLGLPHTNKTAIASMRELLTHGQTLGWAGSPEPDIFKGQALPALEMRDIEHSLCEFDKYCRVLFGEGEPRAKFNGRG
jgi:hypothetical protein